MDDRRRFFIPNLLFIIYICMYDVVIVGGASAGLTADRRVLMNV
jgi:hypothetical protein